MKSYQFEKHVTFFFLSHDYYKDLRRILSGSPKARFSKGKKGGQGDMNTANHIKRKKCGLDGSFHITSLCRGRRNVILSSKKVCRLPYSLRT